MPSDKQPFKIAPKRMLDISKPPEAKTGPISVTEMEANIEQAKETIAMLEINIGGFKKELQTNLPKLQDVDSLEYSHARDMFMETWRLIDATEFRIEDLKKYIKTEESLLLELLDKVNEVSADIFSTKPLSSKKMQEYNDKDERSLS